MHLDSLRALFSAAKASAPEPLPEVPVTGAFPYRAGSDWPLRARPFWPQHPDIPAANAPGQAAGKLALACRVPGCSRRVPLAEMRSHVGAHILLSECSPSEAEPAAPAADICGWCGGEGHTTTLGRGKHAGSSSPEAEGAGRSSHSRAEVQHGGYGHACICVLAAGCQVGG